MLRKSNTKFQFKTAYLLGVWGLTTSSYTVCDRTDLWIYGSVEYTCTVYTAYIHCNTVYIHFYATHAFVSKAIKM